MKKMLVFILVLGISSSAFAHPPSKIEAVYDNNKRTLEVDITHPVYDAKTHYIKSVIIAKNGKEIISDNFDRQEDTSGQKLQYVIRGLEKGDKITARAFCNVYGVKEGTVMISE